MSSVTIKSKSGNKEWFNIVLYNNLKSDYINRSLLYQEIKYKVDDNDWETFTSYFNNYINRKTVYGYQVTIENYETAFDENNTAYSYVDNIKKVSQFSILSNNKYDAFGDIFMEGLIGLEINELDDMTVEQLMSYISSLNDEVRSIKEQLSYNTINLYATQEWVESQHYLTEHQDLSSTYVSYGYFSYNMDNIYTVVSSIEPVSYQITYSGDGNIDLSDFADKIWVEDKHYATESYVIDKVSEIEITGGNYDDTEIRNDLSYLSDKVDSFILGPSANLKVSEISYNTLVVDDISSLFDLNDLFEYTFKTPYLQTTYTHSIWNSSPNPSMQGNKVTFKENIDIIDFEYKLNVESNINNFSKDLYLIQKATERIYFPNGNELILTSYNQQNINLSQYIVTNFSSYGVNVDWINMPNIKNALIQSNANSLDQRTATITLTDSNSNDYTFTIIQPGNPNYDPNGGSQGGGNTTTEVEYEIDVTGITEDPNDSNNLLLETNGIILSIEKANGSSKPVLNSGTQIRAYAKNIITISSTNLITKIEFAEVESYKSGYITSNIETLGELIDGNQIWTGEYNEIVFTVSDSGQYRFRGLKVTVLE